MTGGKSTHTPPGGQDDTTVLAAAGQPAPVISRPGCSDPAPAPKTAPSSPSICTGCSPPSSLPPTRYMETGPRRLRGELVLLHRLTRHRARSRTRPANHATSAGPARRPLARSLRRFGVFCGLFCRFFAGEFGSFARAADGCDGGHVEADFVRPQSALPTEGDELAWKRYPTV
jgi:hypothetical protein